MSDDQVREKPYGFVPVANHETNGIAAGHHLVAGTAKTPLLSGTLRGTIVSEASITIASGYVVAIESLKEYRDIDLPSIKQDQLVAAHMRSRGKRILPGSSLKGAIRSVVEAITAPGMQFTPSDPRSKRVRGRNVFEIKNRTSNQQLATPPDLPSISLVNRLFGLTSGRNGYQGHCTFYDAPQAHGSGVIFRRLPLYRPQPDYSEGDPDITTNWWRYFHDEERKQFIGRKFYRSGKSQEVKPPYTAVEACAVGSQFPFTMHFDNLTEVELGVLLIALGADGRLPRMKIGGGKPVSCGTVHFADLVIETLSAASYLDFEPISQMVAIDVYVQAATQSRELFLPGLEKLAEIMTQPAMFTAGGSERLY